MRRLVLALALLITACAPWTPSDFPARVDIGADLTEVQRDALLDGIALLETEVHANVFAPVETNGRRIQRGRISVRSSGNPMAKRKPPTFGMSA